jgi:hypothetical protein
MKDARPDRRKMKYSGRYRHMIAQHNLCQEEKIWCMGSDTVAFIQLSPCKASTETLRAIKRLTVTTFTIAFWAVGDK